MNRLLKFIPIVLLFFAAAPHSTAQIKVRAAADSTTITMGDRVGITVEVLAPNTFGRLVLPQKETDFYGMELSDWQADTTQTGNGGNRITYRLTMQAFDPQPLTIPGFEYVLDGDTTRSNPLTIKVLPVELSPELGNPEDIENLTIHPEESVVKIPSRWYDYIPDWMIWVLLAVVVAALGVIAYLLYKKNGQALFVPRKPVSPYDLAISRLNELKASGKIVSASSKAYFTELTDILRQYIDGRFGINAMEMPTTEILRRLRQNQETRLTAEQIQQVLSLADFVKFAAVRPPQEDSQKTYNTVYSFVEDTKPAPEPVPEDVSKKK